MYIGQVLCKDASTLYLPVCRRSAYELVVGNIDRALCPLQQGQVDFDLYILQHNISSNQQSICIWSDNYLQQYCVFADPQFDYGKGIVIITTPARARYIFKTSSLMSNLPISTHKLLFRTKVSGNKGRGIFANSHISAGSLITQEAPIILIDDNWTINVSSEKARTTLEELAIEKLPKLTRKTFHELYEGHDISNPWQKIYTNGYGVYGGPTNDWPELESESDLGMVAVHANISKINHGCRSNAAVQWDWDLLIHRLYAVRDIAADEEITISYFNTIQTLQERQQYTKKYLGFACACNQCKATGIFADLSDSRVNDIILLEKYLENEQIAPAEPVAMAELLVSLYKQEGLDPFISKAYAIAALEWHGAGYEYQARSWAYQSVKAGLITTYGLGIEEYLNDMQTLLDRGRKHWSWRYRVH
ncbi:lysine methyltransferase [Colletotrichum truncatum]|uniref:Lysine methyltransferase n=1 Tax=Colletotrichum truncatum TaxID=5467 RepID=A0ACC3Z8H0_COLTU|nr:lysine methyltransferase [Colletotrichum truncatum]KAF6789208.1 lysine methyltransferase [Colletotrichum truncatum]